MPPLARLSSSSFRTLMSLSRFFRCTVAKRVRKGYSFLRHAATFCVNAKPRNWVSFPALTILVLVSLTFRNSFSSTYFFTWLSMRSAAFLMLARTGLMHPPCGAPFFFSPTPPFQRGGRRGTCERAILPARLLYLWPTTPFTEIESTAERSYTAPAILPALNQAEAHNAPGAASCGNYSKRQKLFPVLSTANRLF